MILIPNFYNKQFRHSLLSQFLTFLLPIPAEFVKCGVLALKYNIPPRSLLNVKVYWTIWYRAEPRQWSPLTLSMIRGILGKVCNVREMV